MRAKSLILMFLCGFIQLFLGADELPLSQLKQVADGLNIEGGTIYKKYLRNDQIWSNLCIVLDRPFEDGVEWQQLTDSNPYPLKEASIIDYNEAQVNYTYATIMHYYITHAHEISKKPANLPVKLHIQVHRNSSGPNHLELLERLLEQCYFDLDKTTHRGIPPYSKYHFSTLNFSDFNVQIDFYYGADPDTLGNLGVYSDADIVLSFSLVAGLFPEWKSGTMLIPDLHIPFSLKSVHLNLSDRYLVQNHMNLALLDIIKFQDCKVLETINAKFISLNPLKQSKAKPLTRHDFKKAALLQVDGLFNPSQLPSTFYSN